MTCMLCAHASHKQLSAYNSIKLYCAQVQSVKFVNKDMVTPSPAFMDTKQQASAVELAARLRQCWDQDLNWEVIPDKLKQVHVYLCQQTKA